MNGQVFLGGAAGDTTWRADIAIPALESAGITYYNPQLPRGEWTEAREAEEMLAKDAAEVLLFVINGETRGVATVAEIAYYMGKGRPLALAITPIPPGQSIYGQPVSDHERDDLNRGRIFVRTMAASHNIPVYDTVDAAVAHAIRHIQTQSAPLDLSAIRAILDDIQFDGCRFLLEPIAEGYLFQLAANVPNADTREPEDYTGRKWHVAANATRADVVRTALKAALTWQEHETRERFTYRGKRLFGPHLPIG